MCIKAIIACWVVAIAGLAPLQGVSAQTRPAAPAAPAAAPSTPAPVLAEPADRLLKEVGAYIGSAEKFTFHADSTFDHVLPSGQKLQFSAAEEVVLQRPGRLYVEWNGDLGARQFWYDGKSVTVYDPATPFYASEAAAPEIDGMLEQLVPKLSFAPPLADFLYSDPYKSVRGNIQYGFDLGQNDVNGSSGLGFGAGFAIGATVAALPAAAAAISVAGNPYYYANGVYYAPQGGQYSAVPPPQGAVVATPHRRAPAPISVAA